MGRPILKGGVNPPPPWGRTGESSRPPLVGLKAWPKRRWLSRPLRDGFREYPGFPWLPRPGLLEAKSGVRGLPLASFGFALLALAFLGVVWPALGRCHVQPLASRPCVCIGPARIFEGSALRARSSKKGATRVSKGGFGLAFGTPWPPFGRLFGPTWRPRRRQKDDKIQYGN